MSDVMIAVSHVSKSVSDATGTLSILRDIDFTLRKGETAAIVGASGSGKSTLLSIIAGLDTPTQGTVSIDGEDLFARSEDERAALRAAKVGFVFQSFQLLGNLTALENVMLPLELAGRRDARVAAAAMLERVGLASQWARTARTLAHGDQKRLELAIALASQPKVLLLDEPTAGMAAQERLASIQLVHQVAQQLGISCVFTEHDMAVVFAVASRITVLHQGKVLAVGLPQEVRASAVVQQVYLGEPVVTDGQPVPQG
jgi:putative ABC transport system ATP-binding protein